MTDNNSSNDNSTNTRSRLTLKLPGAVSSKVSAPRVGNQSSQSSVKLEIKGRRKDPLSHSKEELAMPHRNKTEMFARASAMSKNSTMEGDDLSAFRILSGAIKQSNTDGADAENKISKAIIDSQPDVTQIDVVEVSESELHHASSSPIPPSPEEHLIVQDHLKSTISDQNTSIAVDKNPQTFTPTSNSGNVNEADKSISGGASNTTSRASMAFRGNYSNDRDEVNVRDKIRKSLEENNKQKEERDKLVQQRKNTEELEKKEALEKKQKKITFEAKPIEEDTSKKKPIFKDAKRGQKKDFFDTEREGEEDFELKKRKKKLHKREQDLALQNKKIFKEVAIPDLIQVSELASRMSEKVSDVVKKLFVMGVAVTSNQAIDADTAEIIVAEFGHTAKRVSHSDVENVLDENINDNPKFLRAPVVTIMGHVDHGKTSLLDALRKSDVASREHGGITQHIGASRIKTKEGKWITFLDTPGHEAFTEMRSRGANVTDIVVLVVAADDGVKEQTIEAINHAKMANVPIIVAVNKIDKEGCNPELVKNELLSHNIVAEELGGDVMFVLVSAKKKLNLDKLEEAILLQAEILELSAPVEGRASGVVLESRVDPSRGVVASFLVQSGSLHLSDLLVVGTSSGYARRMLDDLGKSIKVAGPSVPVEVLGLDKAPDAGEKFFIMNEERQVREIVAYRERKERESKILKSSTKSISELFKHSKGSKLKFLNILIKGDVHGSVEAIGGSVLKLSHEEVEIRIVHSATGAISESDISLASASSALIIGFNVRANPPAKEAASIKNVEIRYYSIIYNLIDDLKLIMSGMLNPTISEQHLGNAEIRQVFKVSGVGKIAGSFVTSGIIKRNCKCRLIRGGVVIHEGALRTLKRFKEDVKEVRSGFECGVAFENYEDIKEKDLVECYEIVEKKRTID